MIAIAFGTLLNMIEKLKVFHEQTVFIYSNKVLWPIVVFPMD